MPSPKPEKTEKEFLECTYLTVRQIRNLVKAHNGRIQLSPAQAKAIWSSLHTVTLYLEQPEKIRKAQVQKIFEVRNTLEMEFKEQTGKQIDE